MKKAISFIFALILCLNLCACGGSSAPAQTPADTDAEATAAAIADGAVLPENMPVYSPGVVVETDFGSVTVLDAAFCAKAQLIDAKPRPAYNSCGDGRIVFAMRTIISNTSGADLVLMDGLKVTVQYDGQNVYGCSKGGNYESSDPLYKSLPAGTTGEYIICGRVPVEIYQANHQFRVSFNGAELGFDHDAVQLYNSMGYQDGENLLTSIENLIALAGSAPAEAKPESADKPETVPELAFALEDARYEMANGRLTVEVKIRNNSDISLPSVVFDGVILDARGDILENCSCVYRNGMEAGQAGWTSIRISESATLEAIDSIKFITVWYKDDPQSPSHNLRFDLPLPFVIDIHELEMKK